MYTFVMIVKSCESALCTSTSTRPSLSGTTRTTPSTGEHYRIKVTLCSLQYVSAMGTVPIIRAQLKMNVGQLRKLTRHNDGSELICEFPV